MTEQCAFCGNKHLTAKTTRYLHESNGEMLLVNNVPCIECDFCHEQYFDVSTLKRIEASHNDISAHRKQPRQFVSVAMDDFLAA